MDYPERDPDRRGISMYLQAEYFRRKNRLQDLQNQGKTARMILYGLAGILFSIGLFFVFF